jgi:hypothetical protein
LAIQSLQAFAEGIKRITRTGIGTIGHQQQSGGDEG